MTMSLEQRVTRLEQQAERAKTDDRAMSDAMLDRTRVIDRRIGVIESRLDQVDGRLDRMEGRLTGIEQHGRVMDGRLDRIESALEEVLRRLPSPPAAKT